MKKNLIILLIIAITGCAKKENKSTEEESNENNTNNAQQEKVKKNKKIKKDDEDNEDNEDDEDDKDDKDDKGKLSKENNKINKVKKYNKKKKHKIITETNKTNIKYDENIVYVELDDIKIEEDEYSAIYTIYNDFYQLIESIENSVDQYMMNYGRKKNQVSTENIYFVINDSKYRENKEQIKMYLTRYDRIYFTSKVGSKIKNEVDKVKKILAQEQEYSQKTERYKQTILRSELYTFTKEAYLDNNKKNKKTNNEKRLQKEIVSLYVDNIKLYEKIKLTSLVYYSLQNTENFLKHCRTNGLYQKYRYTYSQSKNSYSDGYDEYKEVNVEKFKRELMEKILYFSNREKQIREKQYQFLIMQLKQGLHYGESNTEKYLKQYNQEKIDQKTEEEQNNHFKALTYIYFYYLQANMIISSFVSSYSDIIKYYPDKVSLMEGVSLNPKNPLPIKIYTLYVNVINPTFESHRMPEKIKGILRYAIPTFLENYKNVKQKYQEIKEITQLLQELIDDFQDNEKNAEIGVIQKYALESYNSLLFYLAMIGEYTHYVEKILAHDINNGESKPVNSGVVPCYNMVKEVIIKTPGGLRSKNISNQNEYLLDEIKKICEQVAQKCYKNNKSICYYSKDKRVTIKRNKSIIKDNHHQLKQYFDSATEMYKLD